MDSESYPVFYYNGQGAGELRVSKEGIMTVVEADCDMREDVVRLVVYGEGEPRPLGVLVPEGGRLRLKKRLSRAQLSQFPSPITHAAPEGETEAIPAETEKAEPRPEKASADDAPDARQPEAAEKPKREAYPEPAAAEKTEAAVLISETAEKAAKGQEEAGTKAPAAEPEPMPNEGESDGAGGVAGRYSVPAPSESGAQGDQIWWPEPTPWSLFSDTSLKAACREIRGALMTFELDATLLAVPVEGEFPPLPIKTPAEVRVIAGRRYAIVRVKDGAVDS